MKALKLAALLSLFAYGTGSAATITLAKGFGTAGLIPITEGGTLLTDGTYYLGIGSYATAPIISTIEDLQAAVGSFQEFATSSARTAGGFISGSGTSVGGATPELWNNQLLYLLVGNAATKAGSTEFALMTFSGTPNLFPANVAGSGSTSYSTASVASVTVLSGAGTEIDNATGADHIRLAPIPEPSAVILGAIGALGMLRRRRI